MPKLTTVCQAPRKEGSVTCGTNDGTFAFASGSHAKQASRLNYTVLLSGATSGLTRNSNTSRIRSKHQES